jgi:hypothetical protein
VYYDLCSQPTFPRRRTLAPRAAMERLHDATSVKRAAGRFDARLKCISFIWEINSSNEKKYSSTEGKSL